MSRSIFLKNAIQFSETKLKLLSGKVPQQIKGNYYRNGAGLFNFGTNIIHHWFHSQGFIVKLSFINGNIHASAQFPKTHSYLRQLQNKTFKSNKLSKFLGFFSFGPQYINPANTSVLVLENQPNILALCQAGKPFVMNKKTLQSIGFSNYNWIKSAFSAHYKRDASTGQYYNIGMHLPQMKIMKFTKNIQKLAENEFKLRKIQTIHDFCLAGDYLIIFEGPIQFNFKKFLLEQQVFTNCQILDKNLPTLIHIYSKNKLQLIKTLSVDPFYSFHFTNGYSTNQKIVFEFVKYDLQSTNNLLKMASYFPKFTQPHSKHQHPFIGTSTLQQMTIQLTNNFAVKTTKSIPINGEFPICQDEEVGKNWRYTYAIGSQQNNLLHFNTIYKFDRQNGNLDKIKIKDEQNVYLNEPCLIRTPQKLYIMCMINKFDQSYVHLYSADTLQLICQLQMPLYVPPSFHGKWSPNQVTE